MDQNEFYKNLPMKRMGSGALIFDESDRLLLVKPTYKDQWSIPGGVVDQDESPRQACLREVEEEIGIKIPGVKFLCIDWTSSNEDKNESLQFIFYGGRIGKGQIEKIKIDNEEIGEYKFVEIKDADKFLGGQARNLAKRLPQCLEALKKNAAIYLENGE